MPSWGVVLCVGLGGFGAGVWVGVLATIAHGCWHDVTAERIPSPN